MASLPIIPARTPVRTCIGCRERAPKRELLRVVVGTGSDGQPVALPDPDGTAPGRGAHLHPSSGCYDLAVRRRAFSRALRAGAALAGTPVGEFLAHADIRPTDRDWSSSS